MRTNSVTYAKAIAIILMVLSHARFWLPGQVWISMFHMPLFFMMSGYCFKESYLTDIRNFIKRRFSGIYWPFVKWSVFFVLLHNIFYYFGLYSIASTYNGIEEIPYSMKDIVRRIMSVIFSLNYNEQLLGGYWFLRELFLGYGIFYVFVSFTHHKWAYGGIIVIFNILLLRLGSQTDFYSGVTVLAFLFIWSGYVVKYAGIVFYKNVWFIIIGLVIVTIGSFLWPASCLTVDAISYIPYVLTAIIGSLSVLSLCERLDNNKDNFLKKALRYIGNNTLTVLTWHFLSFKLVSYLIVTVYELPFPLLGAFPVIEDYAYCGWSIAYFIIGLAIPLGLASINKYISSKWMKL